MGGRNENLMDHVFKILEQYTTNLQQEVEERTKELMEEKKRSDALLYRMLPKQVADKLKTGSTAARIHLSADSNNLLQMVGGFKTEPRGEVIIKGKGVMETFWLTSQDSSTAQINSNHTNKATNSNDPLYQQFKRSQK
ncbi:heme NO binding associated domain-containing protein [Ditylenchus destructor]|nr:heme NO binding associated domain-containing protein [Ditylenchus destructor]